MKLTEIQRERLASWRQGKGGSIVSDLPGSINECAMSKDCTEAYGGQFMVGESMSQTNIDLILFIVEHVLETAECQ